MHSIILKEVWNIERIWKKKNKVKKGVMKDTENFYIFIMISNNSLKYMDASEKILFLIFMLSFISI